MQYLSLHQFQRWLQKATFCQLLVSHYIHTAKTILFRFDQDKIDITLEDGHVSISSFPLYLYSYCLYKDTTISRQCHIGFVIRIPIPGNPVSILKRDQAVIGSYFLSLYVTFCALNLHRFLLWTNGEGYFLIQPQIITLRSHPNCWWGNTLLSKSSLYILVPSEKKV